MVIRIKKEALRAAVKPRRRVGDAGVPDASTEELEVRRGGASFAAIEEAFGDHGEVVVRGKDPMGRTTELTASAAPSAGMAHGKPHESLQSSLRRTLMDALFRAIGRGGSILHQPSGTSFALRKEAGEGEVRADHVLTVPLPEGNATSHRADVAIETGRSLLVLDIVPSHMPLSEVKARSFDALQFRRLQRCFTVLVFVRCPGQGLTQQQAEAIGHGYDHVFGLDEADAHSEMKVAALVSRVQSWLSAGVAR